MLSNTGDSGKWVSDIQSSISNSSGNTTRMQPQRLGDFMSKSDEMMKSMMASIASQAMGVFLQGKEEQFRLNQEYQELLYSDDEPDERESVDYYKDLERALAILNSENRELKIIVGELQGYKETAPDYKVWYKKAVEEIKSLKAVIELYEEIVTLEQLTAKQKEKELNARTSNSKGVN